MIHPLIHPYLGLYATVAAQEATPNVPATPAYRGVVVSVRDDWSVFLRLDDGSHVSVTMKALVIEEPERARLREVAREPDHYQDVTLEYGDHPDVTTADLSPDAGFEAIGPWEPYAACTVDETGEYGRHLRTYAARCWRRPLRKVTT